MHFPGRNGHNRYFDVAKIRIRRYVTVLGEEQQL
jgi:hypothetical protein